MTADATGQTLPPDPGVAGLWWLRHSDFDRIWFVWKWVPDWQEWDSGEVLFSAAEAYAAGWRCMYPATPPIPPDAQPIATAPQDGTLVMTYSPAVQDLPPLICPCAWHPNAGWCVDELRSPTLWWRA